MEARKKIIQNKFLSELSLRVDFPKPGFGSSNDGNTARRFFENRAKSAEITGINYLMFILFAIHIFVQYLLLFVKYLNYRNR